VQQANIPFYPISIQFDAHPTKIKPTEGRMVKGTRITISRNADEGTTSGSDGIIAPVQSNEIYCDVDLPSGYNKTIGAYENREINEIYWFIWNSNYQFIVYVIDGASESCTKVYQGSCPNFSLETEFAIPENRVYLRIQYTEINGIQTIKEKHLIFTDGNNNIRQINVNASIGSNSFTTPYFDPVFPYNDCCDFITLAPIAPMYRPNFTYVERVEDANGEAVDKDLPNKLFNRAIQIAYSFSYIDGRPSSVSPYSQPIIVGGTDCSEQNPETLPRCVDLKFWVGNAFVDKIDIYFRECVDCPTGNCSGNWFKYETIDKHNCDEDINWWERTEAWSEYDYNSATNEITYRFCANKECTPIDQSIFEHIQNSVPFKSKALAPIGDRLGLANNLRGSDNMTCEEIESFDIIVDDQPDTQCTPPKRQIKIYMIIRNDSTDSSGNGNECEFLFGNSKGGDQPIDGRFYFGGFGWRKHPVTGTKKVAIDGRSGWDSWKDYKQYVPSKIDDATGGFIGYLAGTQYTALSTQVKYFDGNCDVEELGIIYRDLSTMYNTNGSFDSLVEALKDGEYLILQEFVFEEIPAGKYVFRVAGHRTGMDNGYEQTSTYIYGSESITACPLGSDECVTPAIKNDYEWTIDVCDCDYNSLNDGSLIKLLDLTYPDPADTSTQMIVTNIINYNLVREVYLYEDEDNSIPFEKQQANFTFGYFKDTLTGLDVSVDGFEVSGIPLLLFNPTKVNFAFLGVPIPCPTAGIPMYSFLETASGVVPTTLRKTDHNGFVFHREQFWRWYNYFNTIPLCLPTPLTYQFGEPTLGTFSITYTDQCYNVNNINIQVGVNKIQPAVTVFSPNGYRGLLGTVGKSTGTSDDECNRYLIKGKILSDTGKKLAGINVGYTGSQFVKTDGFGNFTLTVHQNTSFNRSDFFIISNSGNSCLIACIDGSDESSCILCCDETYQEITLDDTPCVLCEKLEIDMGEFVFKKINFPDKGLKGRYGWGVAGWDCYGRIVTGGVNVIKYTDINECWTKHPIVRWTQSGIQLNPEIKYLTFFRTPNLNGTILQWVADEFYLLDKNGNKTTSKGQAVAIAVDMTSLLEYNRTHTLGTLVNYQFVKGDMLRIIADCGNPIQYIITGSTFGNFDPTALETELSVTNNNGDTATTKTNFATDNGATIIINYDNRIDELLNQCAIKIEILRPFACETNINPYCEISDVVIVKNGYIVDEQGSDEGSDEIGGILNTWDIYKIFRNVPKDIDCTSNPSDDPYFSQNITDFWGAGCTDCGRRLTENPYAERKWIENELAVSFEWVNNGNVNGLSTFWNENVKNFKGQDWAGIMAMYPQRSVILFICKNDWFTAKYDQNWLVVNENGVVTANLPDKISDPTQKNGMLFGVSEQHISSVVFFEGMAYWLDAKNGAIIACDFQQAKDISLNSIKGWTLDKTMFIQNYNQQHKNDSDYLYELYEVVGGICPLHYEYHLTVTKRNVTTTDKNNFINQQRDIYTPLSETMVFNMKMGVWQNMRHYVPEYYGKLRTSSSGIQFISFVNGVPYKHNGINTSYLTFYGIECSPVIEISVNNTDSKVKILGAISEEIQPFELYIDRIITEEENSFSYVPSQYFERKENIQYAQVLCDMSSYFDPNIYKVSMLVDGKRIFGRYALVRVVATQANQSKYFELAKIWMIVSGSELSMKPQVAQ
jgi:hypothetical protein